MNIHIYWHKKNFETQKAERYFKERRLPYRMVDLKKHRLGKREVELFARAGGAKAMLDLDSIRVKSHAAAYTNTDQNVISYVLEEPWLLVSPIIRLDNHVVIGFQQEQIAHLLSNGE